MFRKLKEKFHPTLRLDNLAVPEVHTGEYDTPDDTEEKPVSILYDNLAVPEIQFVPHKKEKP